MHGTILGEGYNHIFILVGINNSGFELEQFFIC